MLGLVFSRGLAAIALTLVPALPALAQELPPAPAQGPADAGQSPVAAAAEPPALPPAAGSLPAIPRAQDLLERARDVDEPAVAAEPGAPPRKPGDGPVQATPSSQPAEPEPAPHESGRVGTRSAGPPDRAGARRRGRARVPGAPGRLPPRAADPEPAAARFREAFARSDAGASRGTESVAAAASSAAPDRAPSTAAETRSEPIPPAQPLPVRIVPRPVRQIVEVVPGEIWVALGTLALLALALGASSWTGAIRARRLRRQRTALLQEVGLLQAALLPSVPDGLPVSVAYRPADGAAAGGSFYDAFALADGRTAIVLGGLAGDGRDALARTTFIRYTLRAYLEAGLDPREVVKVGAGALEDHLAAGFATVTVAVHEPATGRFTYASAGQGPPLVAGSDDLHEPVTACSSPPLGVGARTGLRQTTFTLTAGARACLHSDGVTDALVEGRPLGVEGLRQALDRLPDDAGAQQLLDAVVERTGTIAGDMAVCLVRAGAEAPAVGPRVEELEVDEREVGDSLELFLRACGVALAEVPGILREAGEAARREGSATVRVRLNDFRPGVDVVPGNLVLLEERRRAALG